MNLRNCLDCGKLCIDNPAKLCPDCLKAEEVYEQKVAEYLREIKRASITQIHEATGVKERIIMRMLKSGRIFSEFQVEYPCETCGKLIDHGRVCDSCSRNILSQVIPENRQQAKPDPAKRKLDRTHIYNKNNQL